MSEALQLATWVIEHRHPRSAWPRAAAILLRQHLEAVVAGHWHQHQAPGMASARQRNQLIALPTFSPGAEDLAEQLRLTWYQLTRACHGGAYQLAPSGDQLLAWAATIERFAAASRAMGEAA